MTKKLTWALCRNTNKHTISYEDRKNENVKNVHVGNDQNLLGEAAAQNSEYFSFQSMFSLDLKMSHVMREPTFCVCKNKVTAQLISAFVFAT